MDFTLPTRDALRRLAAVRPERGRVLSVFIDLDPSTFGTAEARGVQIGSLLNDAGKQVDATDLDHDTKGWLRDDIHRIRAELDPQHLAAGGAHGLAVFACAPEGLFEVVRLPRAVRRHVVIAEAPHVEPLVLAGGAERWCVVLAAAEEARIFLGDEFELTEQPAVASDHPPLSREQGEQIHERQVHLRTVAAAVFDLRDRFDRLALGGAEPARSELAGLLHNEVAPRVSGRLHVEAHASPAEVLDAARVLFDQVRAEHEDAALERLRAGLGRNDGSAVSGSGGVLEALEQRRVETLLVQRTAVDDRELLEPAVELALEQAADVLTVSDVPEVEGVAALLRF